LFGSIALSERLLTRAIGFDAVGVDAASGQLDFRETGFKV
jgi:hypothetical protein